jgi:hypothetical protein
MKIMAKLESCASNPLFDLEEWRYTASDYLKREVGFCAEWTLDNLCKWLL